MDSLLGTGLLLGHAVVCLIVGSTAAFCTNKPTLFLFTFLVAAVYIQILAYDGCVASKWEGKVPFTDIKATQVVSGLLGFSPEDVQCEHLERALVSGTLLFFLFKMMILFLYDDWARTT